jgi:hypothetical protein
MRKNVRRTDGDGSVTYFSTFIEVAPDTTATSGTIPPIRGGARSIAALEYELISRSPYVYTQEDVQFAVHVQRSGISAADLKSSRAELWDTFFSKSHACMRASPLPKSYGWGLHFDEHGKVALVASETELYRRLSSDPAISHTRAMRARRA